MKYRAGGWDGAGENAEHKNKKQILRRCGHWPVETCHTRERIVDTRGAPHTPLLLPYSVLSAVCKLSWKILPYYFIWLNIVRFEILFKSFLFPSFTQTRPAPGGHGQCRDARARAAACPRNTGAIVRAKCGVTREMSRGKPSPP